MPTDRSRSKIHLRVSSYDRVSSWIVSMLIVACVTVGALFVIFVTRKFIVAEFAVPVTPIATGGGGTGGTDGAPNGGELEVPATEEIPDEPQIEDTLNAVASAVETRTAVLADETLDIGADLTQARGDNRTPGSGGGRGGGIGGGIGSGIGPGRGGPGEPRREIRFEPISLLEYAQWLDFFGIELGVLGQDNKVYYAYNLSQEKPGVRIGDPAEETRLYMIPTDSQFAALDRQLAAKAGIASKGQIILQFYPPKTRDILINLEQKQAGAQARDHSRHGLSRHPHGESFRIQRSRAIVPVAPSPPTVGRTILSVVCESTDRIVRPTTKLYRHSSTARDARVRQSTIARR